MLAMRWVSCIMGFNLVLAVIIVMAPSIWILYYGIEVQWMLLMGLFIVRSNEGMVSGLWNYWCSNVLNGVLILTGIVLGLGSILALVIMCKIGYFPFCNLVISYIAGSSYEFIILDSWNKVIYVGLLINLKLFDAFFSGLFWLVLFNAVVLITLIKNVWNFKVLLFISSLITYLIVIILMLLNLYLFVITCLMIYIAMIICGILLVLSVYSSRLAWLSSFRSSSVWNGSLFGLMALFILALFSFIPSFNFVIKLFSFFLLFSLSASYVLFIVVFMIFIYQVYILRSIVLII